MKHFGLFLLIILGSLNADALQIDETLTPTINQQNKKKDGDSARRLIAVQPDFTANAACLNYEHTFGHGFGESVKSAKKGDWYRQQSAAFIDYFVPGEPPVRYLLKTKRYDAFLGDAENHLWFTNVESPALLARDNTLKFEIVGRETVDFEIKGKIEKREQIKIKVTGETKVGGDIDKTIAFLYVAPHLQNLVVKTELIFPKGGRTCTLRDVSFDVPDGLFMEFVAYRRRQSDKFLTLPKVEDVAHIEISTASAIDWYKSEELLKLLPEFAASEGSYFSKQPFQRGTFVLKNGNRVSWLANGKDSILLYEGSTEQLFRLSKQIKNKATFPIWDKDGKDGFIDVDGNVVLNSENNGVREFSEGLAPVMIGDKWGYINEQGAVVIEPRWKNVSQALFPAAGPFHEGLAVVIEAVMRNSVDDLDYYTYKCGYINTKGKYVIEPKYRRSCGAFSDGLARIDVDFQGDEYEKGKGWIGFIDKQGKWAIERRFFDVSDFSNGFALVRAEPDGSIKIIESDAHGYYLNPKSFYLMDKTGRKVENKKDCVWRYDFREGLALTYSENNQKVFINEQCEEAFRLSSDIEIDASYYPAKGYRSTRIGNSAYFSEGLLLVYKNTGSDRFFGFLDRAGKTAIDFKFADATPFFDGLAGVVITEKDKQYNAYINPQGEIVLKNTRGIAPFYNGLAFHHLATWTISESPNARNIYGYMNKKGKYVWLSPGAEMHLDKNWIKENYVGPKVSERKGFNRSRFRGV